MYCYEFKLTTFELKPGKKESLQTDDLFFMESRISREQKITLVWIENTSKSGL